MNKKLIDNIKESYQKSGEFKSNLNKFFKHFLKEHKPDGIKNIIMYKSKHWDGRDKLNIETLLKK